MHSLNPTVHLAMKCCFCSRSALQGQPITIPGIGPAHQACYEKYLIDQRVFRRLNLRELSDHELDELHDLVAMERNARHHVNDSIELWD